MKKILEEYGLIIVMIIVLCALIALAIFFSVHLKGRVGNTYNQFSNYAGNIVNNVTGGKLTNPIALVKGNQLTYNGNQQELLKANKPASGTLMFKLGESGSYSPSIPKAKDVGSYTVFYKIDGLGEANPKEYAVTATIGKGNNSFTVTPSAKTLTYNGSDQQLINGGSCANGQVQYSLNNSTWSTSIPTGKNAGNYTVYYKVLETENYKGIDSKIVYASINKANSTCTPPTAKDLTYNGSAQALVNAGTATGGTMNYKVNSGSWSTSVPSATNVGNYTVYYKVVGDGNHNDIGEKPVSVTIKANTLTVTLNNNGGTGGTTSVTVTKGSAMPSATAPTKTGNTFEGYYDAQSGGTQYYTKTMGSAKNWDKDSNATLYAHWTPVKSTVTLNVNGGTGGTTSVTATYGSAMPSATAPTKVGSNFGGYYDAQTGGTQYYTATMGSAKNWDKTASTVTLYARWTAKTTTVTLNGNGGSGGTGSVTATYGSAMPSATAPSWTGHTFGGFYDATSGGTQYYTNSMGSAKAWDKEGTTATLYARWTAQTSTVTLNANGGSGGTSSVTATYGSAMPSLASVPTRTGYAFDGYWDNASGGTKYYNADKSSAKNWDKTGNQTLYAHWKANTYTVSFSANNGSGGQTANVTATYGSAMPSITSTKPTRTGYTFGGYYDTSATTGGTQYYTASMTSARSWDKTSATTLYARWTAVTYTVTLNANGGSGGTTSVTATYGAAMPSATAPSRSGYTFVGYYDTSAQSGGTQYYTSAMASAKNYELTSGTTLYARWSGQSSTITLNANGGTGGQSSVTGTYGSNLPTVTLPTRTGYTFVGYYDTSATSGGNQYINASGAGCKAWDKTGNQTLYARWNLTTYTVSFSANGGSGGQTASVTVTYGSAMPSITSTKPTREGYNFEGYYDTNATSGGTQYYTSSMTSARSWDKTSSITLYARWSEEVMENPLYFVSTSAFTLAAPTKGWSGSNGGGGSLYIGGFLEYSKNGTTWTTWEGEEISVPANTKLYMRGTYIQRLVYYDSSKWQITGSNVKCVGNIENLLDYKTVAKGEHPRMNDCCCNYLFKNCTALISAPDLPATTLTRECYVGMFSGCTNLQSVPDLPATTLTQSCYSGMFTDCSSLTSVPLNLLPATTLTTGCYASMFSGCTNLTNAPKLPATGTLPASCYANMFTGCTNLQSVPDLSATSLGNNSYKQMFKGCSSIKTAPNLPATTIGDSTYYAMFQDCTSLTSIPNKLPATTIGERSYESMFQGCTGLTQINLVITNTNAYCACRQCFYGCTNLKSVSKNMLPSTSLADSSYGSMFMYCSSLVEAPNLPATTMGTYCYSSMFSQCSSLTTLPTKLPATTLSKSCYNYMFTACTSLVNVPSNYLPATNLTESCYYGMFNGCTSLVSIPNLPATTIPNYAYYVMFKGCTSLKVSEYQDEAFSIPYRIPTSGTGTKDGDPLHEMFTNTGGRFKSTPTINKTYYLYNPSYSYSRTIQFNANGGSGSVPATITFSSATETKSLTNTIPTRSNYIFRGWSTKQEYQKMKYPEQEKGSRISYSSQFDTTQSGNWTYAEWCSHTGGYSGNNTLTLYAQWVPAYVYVSFDMNGHGSAPATQKIAWGGHPTEPTTTPTASGYLFCGWNEYGYYDMGGYYRVEYDSLSSRTKDDGSLYYYERYNWNEPVYIDTSIDAVWYYATQVTITNKLQENLGLDMLRIMNWRGSDDQPSPDGNEYTIDIFTSSYKGGDYKIPKNSTKTLLLPYAPLGNDRNYSGAEVRISFDNGTSDADWHFGRSQIYNGIHICVNSSSNTPNYYHDSSIPNVAFLDLNPRSSTAYSITLEDETYDGKKYIKITPNKAEQCNYNNGSINCAFGNGGINVGYLD